MQGFGWTLGSALWCEQEGRGRGWRWGQGWGHPLGALGSHMLQGHNSVCGQRCRSTKRRCLGELDRIEMCVMDVVFAAPCL